MFVGIPEKPPGSEGMYAAQQVAGRGSMEAGTVGGIDWSALTLGIIILGGLLCVFYLVLRQNRKDLVDLEELLKAERDNDQP